MQTKFYIVVLVLGMLYTAIKAQEPHVDLFSVSASGGNATGASGSAAYTVGQVFYSCSTSSDGSITEGVQQAFDIAIDTATENTNDIQLSCKLYPNPVTDYIIMNISIEKWNELSYRLYDINGKLLESKKVYNSETSIEMGSYTPSIYYLQIFGGDAFLKSFKILKN